MKNEPCDLDAPATPRPSVTRTLGHAVAAAPPDPSPDVARVAAMFGLGIDAERRLTVVAPCQLTLRGGEVVFVTGPSGSGKSTLLRLIERAVADDPAVETLRFDALPSLPERPLVDALPAGPLEDRLRLLSMAGLGDAPVMLRRPSELSDGQAYRLRLAHAMAVAEDRDDAHPTDRAEPDNPGGGLCIVLADEFGATLDRRTAGNVARQVRKWTRRRPGVGVVVATTHDDLLEPLEPDTLVEVHLGASIEVHRREGG